jgi:hypothetical protein
MTVLWIVWGYLVVGSIIARIYGNKLMTDVQKGNPRAIRLLKVRDEIGDEKFWTGFYILTTVMYGLFFVHAILTWKGTRNNVQMPSD